MADKLAQFLPPALLALQVSNEFYEQVRFLFPFPLCIVLLLTPHPSQGLPYPSLSYSFSLSFSSSLCDLQVYLT
jgi:hypothetical protein